MSTQKLTRSGARSLTATLDRIATVIQNNPEILGMDPKVALDFAKRADLVSDMIEKTAITNFPKTAAASNGGFDPENIGDKKSGPLEMLESKEPWMKGEFTQQEFTELSKKQEAGLLPEKGDQKVASAESRLARLERILIRMASEEVEEEKDEEAKKKAGEEKVEEEKEEEAKKKASDRFAGFNLFE